MERAIRKYIKKKSEKMDSSMGEDYINQTFDALDSEIDEVRRGEIKRARRKKMREWKRIEKENCRHNKGKRLRRKKKRKGVIV